MAILPPSVDQDFYSKMRDLKWSSTEKAIARRSFDRVLQQELDANPINKGNGSEDQASIRTVGTGAPPGVAS
jgi:hypothetical protein